MLPETAYTLLTPDMRMCRLLNGLWQVSGAHGPIDPSRALPDMLAYHEAGFTTWDLADHYGPAEDFIGAFRDALTGRAGAAALSESLAFTKWVPRPGRMTRQVVEAAIDRSRARMKTETIDLLQFHWWDYRDKGYLDALHHLSDLRDEGKIRHIGLTNFDSHRLELITAAGIRIVSNQVQFSLVDQRPLARMIPFCQQHGIALLAYGGFAGGLIGEAWHQRREPGLSALTTASQRKYKRMIDAWGGWEHFQHLLRVLRRVGQRHDVGIGAVAARWVLEQAAVGGVIVGARLGESDHRAENAKVFSFALDDADHAEFASIGGGRDLMTLIGDCGDEYR